MKHRGIIANLALALLASTPAKAGKPHGRAEHQRLTRELAEMHGVLKHAQQRAAKRRLAFHTRGVLAGYQRKIALVRSGRGHNTLAGIPAQFITKAADEA